MLLYVQAVRPVTRNSSLLFNFFSSPSTRPARLGRHCQRAYAVHKEVGKAGPARQVERVTRETSVTCARAPACVPAQVPIVTSPPFSNWLVSIFSRSLSFFFAASVFVVPCCFLFLLVSACNRTPEFFFFFLMQPPCYAQVAALVVVWFVQPRYQSQLETSKHQL